MNNIERRHKIWRRVYTLLELYVWFLRKLPDVYKAYLLEKSRFQVGWVGIAKRYAILKSMGCKFSGDGYRIIGPNVYIGHPDRLEMGNNVTLNDNSYLECNGHIVIGNDVLIGHGVSILSNTHNYEEKTTNINLQGESYGEIVIGDNVWIGAKATIVCGVHIGANSIIGANAFVNKDVGENEIVAGVPARVIRYR